MSLADAIRNALTGVPLPQDRPPLPEPEWERQATLFARPGPTDREMRALEGLDPIVFGAEPRVRDGWIG